MVVAVAAFLLFDIRFIDGRADFLGGSDQQQRSASRRRTRNAIAGIDDLEDETENACGGLFGLAGGFIQHSQVVPAERDEALARALVVAADLLVSNA